MLSTLACAGCLPMVEPVYRPSAPGGEVLRAHCPPEPRSVIRFERHGIRISARATYLSSDGILVTATFEVPQGSTVRLPDPGVEVAVGGRVYFGRQFPGEPSVFRHGAVPDGEARRGKTLKHEKFKPFWFQARVLAPRADAFTLKLPRFMVNDALVDLPIISYSRHVEFYIAPINC